jgi:hypothetical protein
MNNNSLKKQNVQLKIAKERRVRCNSLVFDTKAYTTSVKSLCSCDATHLNITWKKNKNKEFTVVKEALLERGTHEVRTALSFVRS